MTPRCFIPLRGKVPLVVLAVTGACEPARPARTPSPAPHTAAGGPSPPPHAPDAGGSPPPSPIALRPRPATVDPAEQATEDVERALTQADRVVRSRLAGLPLVSLTAGGFAMQPCLRVTVTRDAVGVDNVAMLQSWRLPVVARALSHGTAATALTPVDDPAVVPLRDGLPWDRDGWRPLVRTLGRVRDADALRAGITHGPPWNNVNVLAAPDVPWSTVHAVLDALDHAGLDQANLAARREGHTVVLTTHIPGEEAPDAPPPLPLTVRLRATGLSVSVGQAPVAQGCTDPGTPWVIPLQHGQPDTAALSACLTTLRTRSRWHDRLGLQRSVGILAGATVPWSHVLMTVAAAQDSTPGARDLFTNPTLGLLP